MDRFNSDEDLTLHLFGFENVINAFKASDDALSDITYTIKEDDLLEVRKPTPEQIAKLDDLTQSIILQANQLSTELKNLSEDINWETEDATEKID